jgi:hypothetical protein
MEFISFILDVSDGVLFTFPKLHPQINIGKSSFDVLHPFFVKQMKEWNVCCCIYHVEIDELQGALNNMHTKFGIHS